MRLTFRGPFTRWPRASDAVLAAALGCEATIVRDGPGDTLVIRSITVVPLAVFAVLAVASAAMYARRRAPLPALGVVAACWALLLLTYDYDVGLMAIVMPYAVGRYAKDARKGLAGLAAMIAVLALDGVLRSTPWTDIGFGAVVLSVTWYIGRRVRLRGERTDQQRRQRADEMRRIVAEERTHIARELHDVVAHQVSMMTVQAGAAQAVAATDPDGARQAMAAVELAGRQTLDELRHLLGVLRPETERDGVGPQPGLADLPRLIEQVRTAGLEVRITDDVPTPLPTRVQLSAYRIVQEALTNVLKHGGPGARTDVRLRHDGSELTIEVVDNAGPGPTRPQTPGHGIIGMRERATLLGGSLETGPGPEGGFRVVARLPVDGIPG